jgi:hypothetical protein
MAKSKHTTFQLVENKGFQFASMKKLEFKENRMGGWINYGSDNIYPQELIRLYNEHPEHRAIINRKARYVWGKGIKAKNPQDEAKVNLFVDSFNSKESLNEIGTKLTTNTELFNGLYVQVVTNMIGKPLEYHILNSANCRISECETTLYFSKCWEKNKKPDDIRELTRFDEKAGKPGSYFIDFKYYSASATKYGAIYPVAQYQSIVGDIDTDIKISTYNANYVGKGFSAGKVINFYKGVPTPDLISKIDRNFKQTYTGEEGESVMVVYNDPQDKEPTVLDTGSADLAEKFKFTSQRAQKKIFLGHEIAPELFNTKFDDSFLSASADLITLQELHVKGYIEPRQEVLLQFLAYLSYLKTGEYLEMEFEPLGLIGVDIQSNPIFTEDEKRAALGYKSKIAPVLGADGKPVPVEAKQLNSTLTNLTGRQLQGLLRIVSKYDADKINKEAAILSMMSGFGLSREDALTFLDENDNEPNMVLSSQTHKILMALEMSAEDDNDDEIVKTELAHIHNSNDALKYERMIMKMSDALTITVEELDSAVLNALKGNPTLTVDQIAKQLNYDILKIQESAARLIQQGLLESSGDIFKPTSKGISKDTEPPKQYEIYTVYKYALRTDENVKLKAGGSSRPFCQKLMNISNGGKHWKFETIDKMENDLATNVWDYRGGFYTNPNTKETYPDCRHVWNAVTKRRLVKK